jgi:hypothetical protein
MDEFTWNIVEETPITGETAYDPIIIDEPKTVSYQGINKGLVRNYYSYTPAVKQQINLSLVDFAMVWDAANADTISTVFYDSTTFVANINSTYIIVWELSNGSIETLTLAATEIFEETSTVTFNVLDSDGAVADASIAINETSLTTNASGSATIELEDGTYKYTITANNYENLTGQVIVNGSAITVTNVLTPVGISNKNQVYVNIYPNPTQGNITIESRKLIDQISLFTFDGKQILLDSNHKGTLNMEQLVNGIYLLKIDFNGNTITKMIIKSN